MLNNILDGKNVYVQTHELQNFLNEDINDLFENITIYNSLNEDNNELFEDITDYSYAENSCNKDELKCNIIIQFFLKLGKDDSLEKFLEDLKNEDENRLKRILNMNLTGNGFSLVWELAYGKEYDYIELLANYGAELTPLFEYFKKYYDEYYIEDYEIFIFRWQDYLDWEDSSNVRWCVRISSVSIFKFLVSKRYEFNSVDIYSSDLVDDDFFNSKVIKYIYNNNRELFNILDKDNENLHIIFSILKDKSEKKQGWEVTKFLPYLFNLGFDTDYRDNDGNNIFMFACKFKDIDVVNILYNRYLGNGELYDQIYQKNKYGETIIHLAIKNKFNYLLEIIFNNKYVRQKRYNINFDSEDSDEEIEDDILDESSDNKSILLLDVSKFKMKSCCTLLHYACFYDNENSIKLLNDNLLIESNNKRSRNE